MTSKRRPCTAAFSAVLAFCFCFTAASHARAASCSVTNVVGVAFGTYDVFSGYSLDSAGSIAFSCSNVGANDVVTIQLSRGGSSTYFPRRLTSGSDAMTYNLFLDAARTVVWGDGSGGTAVYGPVKPPEGGNTVVDVFGRVPAGQNVRQGAYFDSLVVTVLY